MKKIVMSIELYREQLRYEKVSEQRDMMLRKKEEKFTNNMNVEN